MSATGGPAHRSVSSIRSQPSGNTPSPIGPQTPLRSIPSNFGSPSTLRAEEDCIVIEIGTRYLRAGFAGHAVPKAVIDYGPEQQRRAGDFRQWDIGHEKDWRKRTQKRGWGDAYELWRPDLRGLDLGLVGEKIERAMREAITKYLLIDSRQRRMALVLPSALPLPLLSTILDTLFTSVQPPTISLMSAPVLTTVAAGIRSALVVDIGWAETTVSAVYEYREVQSTRSIRGTKLYGEEMYKMLADAIDPVTLQKETSEANDGRTVRHVLSLEECEEVIARVAWCKPAKTVASEVASQGLTPVKEEDELKSSMRALDINDPGADASISIPLRSTNPPRTLKIPFSKLAEPCETALFAAGRLPQDFDDEELPLHLLVYRALLQLPVDVRSMCMPRVIFVGGGANLLGLKNRVMDDVRALVEQLGWDSVRGKALEELQSNVNLVQHRRRQASSGPTEVRLEANDESAPKASAAFVEQEPDHIEDQLKRQASKGTKPVEHGFLRAIESLGAWSGASLVSQLKVPAISVVDREQWHQHGVAGASREIDISVNNKRQSMGATAFKSGVADRTSWTLGLWG